MSFEPFVLKQNRKKTICNLGGNYGEPVTNKKRKNVKFP